MTEQKNSPDSDKPAESQGSQELVLAGAEGVVEAVDSAAGSVQTGESATTGTLGTSRYVHAAFFAAAILVAYIASKIFTSAWNSLAELPLALEYLPQLVGYDEEVRENTGLVVGALLGILTVVSIYRRPKVRQWADDVAGELSKVTWPDRNAVTRGTMIVIVASLIATVYITILDKFWGFTTGLIYAP